MDDKDFKKGVAYGPGLKKNKHNHDLYLIDIDGILTRMCHGCNFSEEIQ